LKFSPNNPVLVVGKNRGGVDVFRLVGLDEQSVKPFNLQQQDLTKHLDKTRDKSKGVIGD